MAVKSWCQFRGGADSDIMMDMFERLGYDDGEVEYVWFDTGLEYDATKRHLKDLEEKYGVTIRRYRPEMTVAQACKKYGVPFLAKKTAQNIQRLQDHGFDWTDDSFEELVARFPNCMSAIKWWKDIYKGRMSVMHHLVLKEFMMEDKTAPKISDKCCNYAKKKTAKIAEKDIGATLSVIGVRRAEGGIRAVSYTSCFSDATDRSIAQFRPIFYFTDQDKQEYKEFCGVTYSDCYEVWGLTRTGCACCPFGYGFEEELEILKQYEPNLYAAACKIFGPSYEYTRKYRAFKEDLKEKRKQERKRERERKKLKEG